MEAITYEIQIVPKGTRGMAAVRVAMKDCPGYTHTINLLRADQRAKFVKQAKTQFPSLDEEELRERLEEHADTAIRREAQLGEDDSDKPVYEISDDGIYYNKPTMNGVAPTLLANFQARIHREVNRDDGVERSVAFEIEAKIHGQIVAVHVPAEEFGSMRWPIKLLGAKAIVSPGHGSQDQLRAAIQHLSEDIQKVYVYTHTGWRRIGDTWRYLHGGGGIGPDGNDPDVSVELEGVLEAFRLPDPPEGDELQEAIRASLRILKLGPDPIVFVVYAALWRSILPNVYFSLFDVGPTGVLKSALAALLQQHFGAGFHGKNLPGSFLSTENALEMLAFTMKDALVVVDDFAPSGVKYDLQKQNKIAERLFRGQGNHSARQRCRQDGSMRPPKPSRGLPIGTGEDTPSMPSIRARLVIVEISNGDISIELLSGCQDDGRDGLYAASMAGYLKWLASRYAKIGERIEEEMRLIADDFRQASGHLRTADNAASLMLGFRYFMGFALDVGAIDAQQHDAYLTRAKAALLRNATTQAENQKANDPISRFFVYLRALLSSGKVHVADMDGNAPASPGQWGWRRQANDGVMNLAERWLPQGTRIGNVDGDDLYLNWSATYIAVTEYAEKSGYGIGVAEQTLLKRLDEAGHLKSTERGLKVRRQIEGGRPSVAHFLTDFDTPPFQKPAQLAQPAHKRR